MNKYSKEQAKLEQLRYVEAKGLPHFAPENGVCWKCSNNIYEPKKNIRETFGEKKEFITGITVEEAKTSLVTGCPHCNISYCS